MTAIRRIFGGLLILAVIGAVVVLPPETLVPAASSGRSPSTGSVSNTDTFFQVDAEVGDPVTPAISVPARDLPLAEIEYDLDREVNPRVQYDRGFDPDRRVKGGIDPLLEVQDNAPEAAPDGFTIPILNKAGQGYTGVNPPDTVGDVGRNYFIQMVNHGGGSSVTIYNKASGSVASGPFVLDNLAPSGTNCASGMGDPIVLYDHLADRWLLSEFSTSGNKMCVYISTTADPTGSYYAYQFGAANFPDYPKYAVWPDGYYITTNEDTPAVYALDRSRMLNGSSASQQRFAIPAMSGFNFQALTPADLDGTPPPSGAPAYFIRHRDDEVHNPGSNNPNRDYLDLWALDVNWSNPGSSALNQLPGIAIAEFNSDLCGLTSYSCFPQPNSAVRLDPLREVVMWRLQYRNFGSYETLVGNFVTDVNDSDHGGVRWFELRRPGGNWTLSQEGTYAPDANNRWMGAISMDVAGNIALGYNVSSSSTYPSLRYVGRRAYDPAGTMTTGEVSLVSGSGSNSSNRYGDYSAMSVDPVDGCTFWFTGEYNTSSTWKTRIGSFKFDSCSGGYSDFTISVSPSTWEICEGENASYDVALGSVGGFSSPVTLSAPGSPGSASFSDNPVTPPGNSALTVSGAGIGSHQFDVQGTSGSTTHDVPVSLVVLDSSPAAPALSTPANGAAGVSTNPTFTWQDMGTDQYTIEIALDAGFNQIINSATVSEASYSDAALQHNTTYFWHVRSKNNCGTGPFSQTFSFTTAGEVGQCGAGTSPHVVYFEHFESGAPGWSHSSDEGPDTWTLGVGISPGGPVSGSNVYHAEDVDEVSDQYLVSPQVSVPTGQNPLSLRFWNYQYMEDRSNGCYDGGVLEISTNNGASWIRLQSELAHDPYDGPIASNYSNPLAGEDAWCGAPQDWLNSVVDLDAFAGETVRFRWRLATDTSVGRPGWDIDDVAVQSCRPLRTFLPSIQTD